MIVILGKLCIEVKSTDKIAFISEFLCIGCGICVKKWVIPSSFILHTPIATHTNASHRVTSYHTTIVIELNLINWMTDCWDDVDVHLRQSILSTFRRTWSLRWHIGILRMRSSCIGYLRHDPVRCWVWWARTVLGRVRRWRFWRGSLSRILGGMMWVQDPCLSYVSMRRLRSKLNN